MESGLFKLQTFFSCLYQWLMMDCFRCFCTGSCGAPMYFIILRELGAHSTFCFIWASFHHAHYFHGPLFPSPHFSTAAPITSLNLSDILPWRSYCMYPCIYRFSMYLLLYNFSLQHFLLFTYLHIFSPFTITGVNSFCFKTHYNETFPHLVFFGILSLI